MIKLITVLLAFVSASSLAAIEITPFLKTKHFFSTYEENQVDKKINESHNFLAIEYRNKNTGYSVSYFTNSYKRKSVMIDFAKYARLSYNFELSYRFGLSTGYSAGNYCIVNGAKYCPIVSAGLAYTKYKVKPKISLIPNALAFSFSVEL